MKAKCPVCSAMYPIPDDHVRSKPRGLLVRCKRCTAIIRVFADGRPPTLDHPPETPWMAGKPAPEAAKAPAPPPPEPLPKPALEDLEPTARETTARRRVVRSTFIEAPSPEEAPAAPGPEATSSAPAPSKPAPFEFKLPAASPKAAELTPFEFKPPTAAPAPSRETPAREEPAPVREEPPRLRETPQPAREERETPREKPAKRRAQPSGETKPAFVDAAAAPEAPPELPPPAAVEDEFSWSSGGRRPEPEWDDELSPFKQASWFSRWRRAKQKPPVAGGEAAPADGEEQALPDVTVGGSLKAPLKIVLVLVLALVLAATVAFIFKVRGEFHQIRANVAKTTEASQIQQEQNRQKLDYYYKYHLAAQLMEAGDGASYERAIEALDQALAVKPDFYRAVAFKSLLLSLLAIEHGRSNVVEESCRLPEGIVGPDRKTPATLRAEAACLLAGGKLDEAEKGIHDALTIKEGDEAEDAESNYLLALLYLKKDERPKAIFTLSGLIAQNPLHFRALHLIADLFASQKQWQQALDAEEKALRLQPENRDAKRRIELYQSQIRGDTAQTGPVPGLSAEMGSDLDKKEKSKQLLAAVDASMRRGAYNEALGQLGELTKLGVNVGEANMRRCQIMVNLNKYDAALESCSSARNYSPDAYYYLGAAYEAMGNSPMARQNYQAYVNARPTGRHAEEVRSILGLSKE